MEMIVPSNTESAPTPMEDPSFDIPRFPIDSGCETINRELGTERERTLSISFPNDPTPDQLNHQFGRVPEASSQLFQNISAPGIVDILGVDTGQHRLYYTSKKEAELNAELIRAKAHIRQLENRVDTLFHENERLKNDLEMLQQSVVGEDVTEGNRQGKRYWSAAEHRRFLEALRLFGPDNKKAISTYVGTRTVTQIRTHMQKYKLRMNRESSHPPTPEDGGRSNGNVPSGSESGAALTNPATGASETHTSFQEPQPSSNTPGLQGLPLTYPPASSTVARKTVDGVIPIVSQRENGRRSEPSGYEISKSDNNRNNHNNSNTSNNNYDYHPFR